MSSHSTHSTLAGVRVLVLDDDTDAAILLRTVLELEHAEVMVTSAVAEALEVISWFDPDVIVSDIMLPGADGNAFIRLLRDQGNETPAIAVSSAVYPQDQHMEIQAGYQCFLTSTPWCPPCKDSFAAVRVKKRLLRPISVSLKRKHLRLSYQV